MPKAKQKPIEFTTTAEVAELFGCDVRTVHRWTAEGRLVAIGKLPGKSGAYLYEPSAIHKALAEAEVRRIPKAAS